MKCKEMILVYPRTLSEKEHNRMDELTTKGGLSPFLASVDESLIDCGLIHSHEDKVMVRTNEDGDNFYNDPATGEVIFLWLPESEWGLS